MKHVPGVHDDAALRVTFDVRKYKPVHSGKTRVKRPGDGGAARIPLCDLAQLDATDGRLYIQHTVVAAVVSKVMRRVLRRKQRRRGEGRQRTMIQ